jgi:hypothetical protein
VLVAVSLEALLSLAAPAVTTKVTPVCEVSLPPAVPGAVKVKVQWMLAPAAKEATGSAGAQVTPDTDPAEASRLQVALVAAALPALVQEKLPFG